MRAPAILVALAAGPVAAQEVDCATATTTIEMGYCAEQAFLAADVGLNDAYAAAIAEARQGGTAREELLRDAQRAWVAYRDAACSAEASLHDGGTIQPMVGTDCKTRLTLARTDDLWLYAEATP